jgi:cytochrome c553
MIMIKKFAALLLVWAGVPSQAQSPATVPAWLFPVDPPDAGAEAAPAQLEVVRLPGSRVTFNQAQLTDLFYAPDWFPQTHRALPEIVARGRAPDVYACGYCHSPRGQGRPENSALAGLPAAYIERQVAAFKSGARGRLAPESYPPTDLMIHVAAHAASQEVAAAAEYFSQQRLLPRVRVIESARVPHARVAGLVYTAIPGEGEEDLGERLLEYSPDPVRHGKRDETMRYWAYVPPGSIRRGRALAGDDPTGQGDRSPSTRSPSLYCTACHGAGLGGVGLVPPLAGRSPSYLLRQLIAFKTGVRATPEGAPMAAVVADLALRDLIAAAAYAASLPPRPSN